MRNHEHAHCIVCFDNIRFASIKHLPGGRRTSALIDTHSHLLAGVDHGCPDLQTSVRMARAAAESGIDTVVCTPHLHEYAPETVESVRAAADDLRGALAEAGVALTLLVGFEADLGVAMGGGLERLKQLTVEGTDTVLVLEMPYGDWPPFLEDTLFRLSAWGLKPVLAHPERSDRVQQDPEVLEGCLKAGAVVQCTVASLTASSARARAALSRRCWPSAM